MMLEDTIVAYPYKSPTKDALKHVKQKNHDWLESKVLEQFDQKTTKETPRASFGFLLIRHFTLHHVSGIFSFSSSFGWKFKGCCSLMILEHEMCKRVYSLTVRAIT
jgi:hypothetical protein